MKDDNRASLNTTEQTKHINMYGHVCMLLTLHQQRNDEEGNQRYI